MDCDKSVLEKRSGKRIFNGRFFQKWFITSLLVLCVTVPVREIVSQQPSQERRIRRPAAARQANRQNVVSPDQEKQEAIKNIPWDELSSSAKGKIRSVVSAHSIFRRMPQQEIFSDPEMYGFLVEHPDVVVAFWEKLGVTDITLRETKDGRFYMKETTGTTAVAEVLYRTKDICIVHGRGRYLGPFLAKPYDGEAILVLRSRFRRDENQEPYVVCDLDAFVRIDNVGAELFARLFATTLGKIADSNFEQTVAFVSHVSEAAAVNPETVRNLGGNLQPVRKDVREEFEGVVDRVALRHIRRNGTQYYFVDFHRNGNPVEEPPYTAYSSVRTRQELPEEFYDSNDGAPSSVLAESVPEKISKNFDSLPQLSSFMVIRETAPAPLESRGTAKPLPAAERADDEAVILGVPQEPEKPVLKGRVVFGTPKVGQTVSE